MQDRLESTIVSLLDKPTILRYGGLDISKIKKVLNKKVLVKTTSKKKLHLDNFLYITLLVSH